MKQLVSLTTRNVKLFFKDKGMFFTSLITPMILLVLYVTFLGNIYKDSFVLSLGDIKVDDKLINGCVGGQLISSILAVSCVTVAFCSNMLMVQDKANNTINDLLIAPVKPQTLALSYFIATEISTLIICYVSTIVCIIYLAIVGWYLTAVDVLLICLDIFLLSLMGTSLSSIINFFLSTQGQISAVGTIVSSGYGFISGAYMPIYSFSIGLQRVIMFLPGTYGTSLLRNHALNGVFKEMSNVNFPSQAITGIKDSVDANLYFFGNSVPQFVMYLALIFAIIVFLGVYILLNVVKNGKR